MRDIIPELTRWLADGDQVAVATVIQTWGSSPRSVGAKMALTASGRIAGSVSGGCVEAAVIEVGLGVLESGEPQLLHFGVADEAAWEVGLACGGTIEIFVQPLDRAVCQFLDNALQDHQPLACITIIAGPAELLGGEMIVTKLGGQFGNLSGELRQKIQASAVQALAERTSRRLLLRVGRSTLGLFVEVILPPPTLVSVGGVHIARALTAFAQTLDYRTVIVDPRRAFGNSDRFSHASELIQAWPEEAFSRISLDQDTAVCVLTHDPKIDDQAVVLGLESPAFYVGALGSRTTQAKRRARLLADGMTEDQLDRLHGPIGVDISADTPEEIALAIMAEVVDARHRHLQLPALPARPGLTYSEARA